ncbi:Uncharacterised protein [uncultured archaeon]|nr:Uncharacterised protein [uncultured archaeon]
MKFVRVCTRCGGTKVHSDITNYAIMGSHNFTCDKCDYEGFFPEVAVSELEKFKRDIHKASKIEKKKDTWFISPLFVVLLIVSVVSAFVIQYYFGFELWPGSPLWLIFVILAILSFLIERAYRWLSPSHSPKA